MSKLSRKVIKDIVSLRDTGDFMFWGTIADEIADFHNIPITSAQCKATYEKFHAYIQETKDGVDYIAPTSLEMPPLDLNLSDPHIGERAASVQFIDIETSLVDAKVFRTGKQNVNADQLTSDTRILTVAGGSMSALQRDGADAIWGISNHHDKEVFAKNPLDDTLVLRTLWRILDRADVIVAHNARFDKSWLLGRFLEKGWQLPSKFSVVCTYQYLHNYNMTSKKLDRISRALCGTKKLPTTMELWMRCSDGEVSAFEEMLTYNKGDIYETLFKVYVRTCQYAPHMAVDMANHDLKVPQCRVSGEVLEKLSHKHYNPTNGLYYYLYRNPVNGLQYVDRYNTRSKKADIGLVKFYR